MSQRPPPVEVARFTDNYGEERIIHRRRGRSSPLQVKNTTSTVSKEMGRAAHLEIATRIKRLRLSHGLSQRELLRRAGLTAGANPKQRMAQIENAYCNGIAVGTMYAIAAALGVGISELMPSVEWVAEQARVKRDGMALVLQQDMPPVESAVLQ